jgi:two-component system, LuxR family, sensor kinase FixL
MISFNESAVEEEPVYRFSSLYGPTMTGTKRVFYSAVFLLAVLGAFLLITTSQWLMSQREHIVSEAKIRNQARVATFEQYVHRVLERAELSVDYVTHELDHADVITATVLTRNLQTATNRYDGIDGIFAHVAGVRAASEMPYFLDETIEASLVADFEATGLDRWLSAPFLIDDGALTVAFMRKVATGSSGGFIFVFLSPRTLVKFSEEEGWADGELISLIGLDGVTRVRRTGNDLGGGESLVGSLVMQMQSANPNGTYEGPHSINQKPYIFSHRRLPEYGVFATSGVWRDRYLGPLSSDRIFAAIVLLIAAILGVIALASLRVFLVRKRGEFAAIQAANLRLNQAQALGKMGDWEYDVQTANIALSDNLQRIYGWSQQVVAHTDLISILGPDDFSKFSRIIEEIKREGRSKTFEVSARTVEGERSHRRVIAQPQFDESGEVQKIYGIDQSIDDEMSLRFFRAQSAATARLQSMSALTATLAHEVNQPLTVIANYLSAATRKLQNSNPADRQVTNFLRKASQQIAYLGDMIGAARDLVSQSDENTEIYSLAETIREALAVLEADSMYDLSGVSVTGCDKSVVVIGRRQLVKQVIYNLLKNAMEVTKGHESPSVEILCDKKGEWIEVTIQDNGPGFPIDAQPFEAFSSDKPDGLGLGLALCRTIIEAQGGRISASNTHDSGARIQFTLPVAPQDAQEDQ